MSRTHQQIPTDGLSGHALKVIRLYNLMVGEGAHNPPGTALAWKKAKVHPKDFQAAGDTLVQMGLAKKLHRKSRPFILS